MGQLSNVRIPGWGRLLVLPLVLSLVLLLPACGSGSSSAPTALSVGGIRYSELELGLLNERARHELGVLTGFALLAAQDEFEELVRPFVERETRSILLQQLRTEIALELGEVDDRALEELYAADPEHELVVRHLVRIVEPWHSEVEREAARTAAEEALAKIRGGADFSQIAGEYSEEPGAPERGGLLEPGRIGTWVNEFWEAASALEVGAVSEVVESPYGYHVIKLEGRRPVPFNEVRDRVIDRLIDLSLFAELVDEWIEEKTSLIAFGEDAISSAHGDLSDRDLILAEWPGGTYKLSDLNCHLSTVDPESRAQIENSSLPEFGAIVRAMARNHFLVQLAREMGLEVSADEEGRLTEERITRYESLAADLGFGQMSSSQAIKSAALRALQPSGQRAGLARGEVLRLAAAIDRIYPVVITAADRSVE